uniref:Tetratricopeptide repeat protein n=1 Tax=Panagrellus redivivus TaxID=6233 RepID=A0A7E4ZV29_PANRE
MADPDAPIYRDLWKEYKMVMEKTKKPKMFKQFKWQDIIDHLRVISHDMIDYGEREQLGQIYRSMADVFEKMDKPLDQRLHYLKAARVFAKLMKDRFEMRYSTESDFSTQMEDNYLQAVQLSIKMGLPHMAGTILSELAHNYTEVRKYELAHRYFLKSARILSGSFFDSVAVMKSIIENAAHCDDMNEPLADLFSLWQVLSKKYPHREHIDATPTQASEEVRVSLRALELDFILISIRRYLKQDELGKSILTDYVGVFSPNLRTSVLLAGEFEEVSKFIAACKKRDHYTAEGIYVGILFPMLDELGKKLMKDVVGLMQGSETTRPDLTEISNEPDTDVRDRMKKLFEFYTLHHREKTKKAEFYD